MDNRPEHVLLILVDGMGLPDTPLSESVYRDCPVLCRLMSEHCVAVDATLGVPGVPQSATGHTAILTGVNASEAMGRHIEGFPGPELRRIIEAENIFSKLLAAGRTCTFANAYATMPGNELPMQYRSATTVSTLAAFGTTRNRDDMLAGKAVLHDLTRACLPERGVHGIPTIAESEAAVHLRDIVHTVDFSLFEYFLTDRVGHRGTAEARARVLASLDHFLGCLLEQLDLNRDLLLIVSDHGNIEIPDQRGHSMNPVPWIAVGVSAEAAQRGVTSILDVTPAILRILAECQTKRCIDASCS